MRSTEEQIIKMKTLTIIFSWRAKLINLNQILNMSKKLLIYLILFVPLLVLNAQKNIPNIPIETFKGTYTTMSKELNEDSFYIISFWATWCVPCINELDAINEVYDELSKEMDFKVWKFDVLLDENHDLKRALNISGLPHTIIARKNQILHRRVGYAPGEELGLLDKLKEYEIK